MKLTLHEADRTLQFEIASDDFFRLRFPGLESSELYAIADRYGILPEILEAYIRDLHTTPGGPEELDGACDYTDHFA